MGQIPSPEQPRSPQAQSSAPNEAITLRLSEGDAQRLWDIVDMASLVDEQTRERIVTRDEWRGWLDTVFQEPPSPSTSSRLLAERDLLRQKYERLHVVRHELHGDLQKVLRAQNLLEIIDRQLLQPDAVPPAFLRQLQVANVEELRQHAVYLRDSIRDSKTGLLRGVAEYIAALREYQVWHGRAEDPIDIPDDLKKSLDVPEEHRPTLEIVSRILPMQYDVLRTAGIEEGVKPGDVSETASSLLATAAQRRVPASIVVEYAQAQDDESRGAVVRAFLRECAEADGLKETRSAHLLLGTLAKQRSSIEAYARLHRVALDRVSLTEALQAGVTSSIVSDVLHDVVLNRGVSLDAVTSSIREGVTRGVRGKDLPVVLFGASSYYRANPEASAFDTLTHNEQSVFTVDARRAAEFLRGAKSDDEVSRLEALLANELDMQPQQKEIIRHICSEITDEQVYRDHLMLNRQAATYKRYLSREALDLVYGDLEEQTDAALRSMLLTRKISLNDAFDLYYLLHADSPGEPKRSYAVTLKLVSLLRKDHGDLASAWQATLFSDVVDLASATVVDSAEQATHNVRELMAQMQIDERYETEIHNAAEFAKDHGLAKLKQQVRQTATWIAEQPVVAFLSSVYFWGPAALATTGVALYKADNFYWALMVQPFRRETNLLQLAEKHGVPRNVAEELQKRLNAIEEARKSWSPSVGWRQARRGRLMIKTAGKSIDDIAKALYRPNAPTGIRSLVRLHFDPRFETASELADYLYSLNQDPSSVRQAMIGAGVNEAEADAALNKIATQGRASVAPPLQQPAAAETQSVRLQQRARELASDLKNVRIVQNGQYRAEDYKRFEKLAREFQKELNAAEQLAPGTRRLAAQAVLGNVSDEVWEVAENVHAAATLEQKIAVLRSSGLSVADRQAVQTLMRLGIAGESDAAIAVAEAAEAVPAASVNAAARSEAQSARLRAARRAKTFGKAGNILAGITTSVELLQTLDQTAKAGQLDDLQTVGAATEFWHNADLAINGGNGAYSADLQQSLTVAQATGREEWVRDEAEVLRQWDQLLVMRHLLERGSVPLPPTDVPASLRSSSAELVAEASRLERRRTNILASVRALADVRSRQFPAYQPSKSLVDQLFTRDGRREGGINVNKGGHFFIFPVPFRNGPIAQARADGFERRQKDSFDRKQARDEFDAVQSDLWAFQGELELYLERLVDLEEEIGK